MGAVARTEALRASTPSRAIAIERKRVLFAALELETLERLEPAFARIDFEVERAPTLRHAWKVAQFSRFDLILIGFGGGGHELDTLLTTVRHPGWANVTTRVALIAAAEELARARLLGDRFGAKALDAALGQLELQGAALDLLRSRARLALRAMTRVSVKLGGATATQLLCQTYDLSRTGLFVITQSRFPLGSSVLFALDLPGGGDGIHGEAEIVRHAHERRDRADGIGLRFVHFAADGERRLAAFLARHLS